MIRIAERMNFMANATLGRTLRHENADFQIHRDYLNELNRYLDAEPGEFPDIIDRDGRPLLDEEFPFHDGTGKYMVIQVIPPADMEGNAYAQAVLFDKNGAELCCSEPEYSLDGEWEIEHDGTLYAVHVVPVERSLEAEQREEKEARNEPHESSKNMKVTLDLRPEVLAVFGFGANATADDVKKRLENFDEIPIIHMETAAGHVTAGMNFIEKESPQAFCCMTPKGSTSEIDVMLADFAEKRDGDVKICVYDDPFSEDYNHEFTLSRQNVIEAMKSIDDYKETDEIKDSKEKTGMTREKAVRIFSNEGCLYDPEERVLYIPDVVEGGYMHGFQVAHISLDDAALAIALDKLNASRTLYTSMQDRSDDLSQWALACIPAPSSHAVSEEGYMTFDGFSLDFENPSQELSLSDKQREKIDDAIEDYVKDLDEEGILKRLVPEENFTKELRERHGLNLAVLTEEIQIFAHQNKNVPLKHASDVAQSARRMGLNILADYAEKYPREYLELQKSMQVAMKKKDKSLAR